MTSFIFTELCLSITFLYGAVTVVCNEGYVNLLCYFGAENDSNYYT